MRALYAVVFCVACSGGSAAPGAGGAPSEATGGAPSAGQGGAGSGVAGAPEPGGGGSAAGNGSGGTPSVAGSSATAGAAGAEISGNAGSSGSNASGGSGASAGASGAGGAGAGGTGAGGTGGAGVAFAASRVIVTGVRGTTTPAAQTLITLHNGSSASVQVTGLALSGPNQALFKLSGAPALPATLAAGADLPVTVQMMTTGATLPARLPDPKTIGTVVLTGTLTATLSAGSSTASVYGLVLDMDNYEPTLGQILTTLGYQLNVGKAQNNWNPNTSMNATDLPGVESGTDEVAASRFVKAGTGTVGMLLVARFSPVGALPYGWYDTTTGCPTGCTTVGTMAMVTDAQTSDKARMVYPPLAAGSATSFDPGTQPFGIWIDSDQKTQKFNEGGNTVNGDWDYSEDALNAPAGHVHRFKSYPLKDASGAAIPKSYLVAVEEAGNGDYQDYVFVLSNVTAVP